MTKVQEGFQGQLAGAQTQITALRADRDKLENERNSVNVQLTDALSKVDALEKARGMPKNGLLPRRQKQTN